MASRNAEELVGRVVGLWRYPVKSMAAEPLEESAVSWQGLAGDRRWAFVRAGQEENGFPWLTQRQRADLQRYRPTFLDPSRPEASGIVVHTPSGQALAARDPALAAELGEGVRVMKQSRGIFDTLPLSLLTSQTVAALGELCGVALTAPRFRPNLLIEASGKEPFPEDSWVGSVLQVGSTRVHVDKRDGRCVIVTLDPETGERQPEVLQALAQERGSCAGVYASVMAPGRIAVGDLVTRCLV